MVVVISLAGLNIYNQFSHLRRQSSTFTLGESKMAADRINRFVVVGVVSLFTVIASIVFVCAVAILVNITESKIAGLRYVIIIAIKNVANDCL